MALNPYQSSEERGAAENHPSSHYWFWWRVTAMCGLAAVALGYSLHFLLFVANGWKHASPSNTPILLPQLFNGLIVFGLLAFMVGVVGWIAGVADRVVGRIAARIRRR